MNTDNKESSSRIKWLIDTVIEGVIFFLPILFFLSIIRIKDDQTPENLMEFSETNTALIASFLLFYIIVFFIYYYLRYKTIDGFSVISVITTSAFLILLTSYCCEEKEFGGFYRPYHCYSYLPYTFFKNSFLIIEFCWIILSYKRKTIIDYLGSLKASNSKK